MTVRANEARRGGAERGGDLDALALGARRQQFDHALDKPAQIDRLDHEIETPGLDLGQIEDFVDQRDQRAARAANRFDVACILRIERSLAQQVGHAENAADRGADLVAHRRQKARLGLARRLRPVARVGRFLEPPKFVAQRFVLGGDACRARFGPWRGADDSRGERNRKRDHRAGLNPERMNPEIRQAGAQIHSRSRSARPRADPLCGPMVSGGACGFLAEFERNCLGLRGATGLVGPDSPEFAKTSGDSRCRGARPIGQSMM